MNLIWRSRIISAAAVILAVVFAWQITEGAFGWPALAGVAALCAMAVFFLRVPLDAVVVGTVLFGYLVGNRGFAQLMPAPGLPLLPAEIALSIAGGWLLVRSALGHTLPWRTDVLNFAVLLWLLVGSVRVLFDLRPFGILAIRDYAMVYYAAFFFIGQSLGRAPECRRALLWALVAASIAQPIAFLLTEVFPTFMMTKLVVRGVPLIYFKGDLAATFMAVSAITLFFAVRGVHRWWAWPVATAEFLYVVVGDNRASMLGALVALAWLSLRARAFAFVQGAAIVFGLLVLVGVATFTEQSWADRRLEGLTERVSSLVDVVGGGRYVSEESSMKGDNNRFRAVWWRTVIDETLATNPAFGLGFGYDLAHGFLQEYNPEMAEDFVTRSPHSIVVSAFGRMGFVGVAAFLVFVAVLAVRTWRVMRDATRDPLQLALWASLWVILVSACFGVVLEGPMGAVVFWTTLGLANAIASSDAAAESSAASDPRLQTEAPADELAPAS